MHENLLTCIIDGVSHLIAADSANMIKVIALEDSLQTKFIKSMCAAIFFIHSPATLLVLGWTPFAFRTALILHSIDSTRCWKHSSEILVHIDMTESHSCCTSMMRISHSSTPQRCSIEMRSDDCGGRLSLVNSLTWRLNMPKMWQENIPYTITAAVWSIDTRQDASILSVVYPEFWLYHVNVIAEIQIHQTRQRFSNLLLSNFGKL